MSGRKSTTADVRFAEKCRLVESGCIEWTAFRDKKGYGRFGDESGVMRLAHRWIYKHAHGIVLPRHIDVCHRCDNPPCVNLDHLFAGTRQQNVDDCVAKGRTSHEPRAQGEKHGMARLTAAEVEHIREKHSEGVSQTELAGWFSVSIAHVNRIVHHKTWTHLQKDISCDTIEKTQEMQSASV